MISVENRMQLNYSIELQSAGMRYFTAILVQTVFEIDRLILEIYKYNIYYIIDDVYS